MKQLSKQETSVRLKKTCYLLSVSEEEQRKKQSGLPNPPLFPWLPSFQSTSQAPSIAVESEAAVPALSWCQDTTPRPRRSSILCVGPSPALGTSGEAAEPLHFPAHRHSAVFFPGVYDTHRPLGPLNPQHPKLQIVPMDFVFIRICPVCQSLRTMFSIAI